MDTCHYPFVQTHRMWMPRVNLNVTHVLWMVKDVWMLVHPLLQMYQSGAGMLYVCGVEARGYGNSEFATQFCCVPKTALNIGSIWEKAPSPFPLLTGSLQGKKSTFDHFSSVSCKMLIFLVFSLSGWEISVDAYWRCSKKDEEFSSCIILCQFLWVYGLPVSFFCSF